VAAIWQSFLSAFRVRQLAWSFIFPILWLPSVTGSSNSLWFFSSCHGPRILVLLIVAEPDLGTLLSDRRHADLAFCLRVRLGYFVFPVFTGGADSIFTNH
jgi:hypothetical protein